MFRKLFFIIIILFVFPTLCSAETASLKVSSFVSQTGGNFFNASVLSDDDAATGWVVNAENKGTGQWLQFSFSQAVVVDSIIFRNGIDLDSKLNQVSRVKGIDVSFGGVHRQSLTLKNIFQKQKIEAVKCIADSLEFTINSVYSDGKSGKAGVSEVLVEYHFPTAEEKVALVVSKKPKKEIPHLSAKQKELLAAKMVKLEKERILLGEMKTFFDKFYSAFVTINEDYPHMFVEAEFLRESSYFESFRSMLKKRGVLKKYQEAVVSTSGLRFNIRTKTVNEVELWVKGYYTVIFDLKDNKVTENSLYILKKEYGEWKVKSKFEY
ncbi:hypothetical protein SAMN05660337_2640 [Maridesulfovibrio ferrireducens]|uniref:NAD glycohydrolase translocation F5/8 type C domain-containing protein n=1 Tax=Maridesulfovibrio ferrireducens TaxID=246191 RepID=A0A1G9J438_9BACT|nr:hypothetical protein [Maridesulfovibrio ferrireducens]SDL32288.1 hypothetical protein SAMN05660337_2640 [Maridesulfovibrio ferrireducens]